MTMKSHPSAPTPRNSLLRELVIVAVIKLLVLVALWWGFIRGNQVQVDIEPGQPVLPWMAATTLESKGHSHDQ